jgi:hypothetical protein
MKDAILIALVVIFAWQTPVFAGPIEFGSFYSVDGPANVRVKQNGTIIDSLDDGKTVKVKEVFDSNWFLVEYLENVNGDIFSLKGTPKQGYTHVDNFKYQIMPLEKLVESDNAIILRDALTYNENKALYFMGREFIPSGDDFDEMNNYGVTVPKEPFKINVYCLDGISFENEVKSVTFDMNEHIEIKIENEYPVDNCIIVNGKIQDRTTVGDKNKSDFNLCPKSKSEFDYCKYEIGDLNSDGSEEIILKRGRIGAPTSFEYILYEIDNNDNLLEIGPIGYFGSS